MKILYISQYFPPEMGAPSGRVFELSKRWVANGAKVTVITGFPHHPTGIIPEKYQKLRFLREKIYGISVLRTYVFATPNKGFVKRILSYISFMFSSIIQGTRESGKQDLIIATSPQFFVGIAGYLISRLKRIPFIFEIRDLWPESIIQLGLIKNPLIIKILVAIEMFLYRKAILIVGVADSTLKILVERGIPEDKICIIKNGVDLNLFNPVNSVESLRIKLNLTDKFIVSYIGTHGLSHALNKIIEAANLLKEYEEIVFLFIGEGAEKKNLHHQADSLGLKNIVFLNQILKTELPDYYSISDVVLVPLKNIPIFQHVIPSKIFEIMAMKKPIIISVKGEAREIVITKANAGIFSQPENSEYLVNNIIRLKNNRELREQLGSNGRKFVNNHFNRDDLADQYFSIIKDLIEKNK